MILLWKKKEVKEDCPLVTQSSAKVLFSCWHWWFCLIFQLWGLDLSDSNQQSDWEAGCCKRELPSNNNEETSEIDIQDPYTLPICGHTTSQFTSSNIGYYVFEYREEEEDTGTFFIYTLYQIQ